MNKVLKPIVCFLFLLLLIAIGERDYNVARVVVSPSVSLSFIEPENDPYRQTVDYLHTNGQGDLLPIVVYSIHSDLHKCKCLWKGLVSWKEGVKHAFPASLLDHLASSVFSMNAVDYYVYALRKIIT